VDLWTLAQLLYLPIAAAAMVAWCRQEGESIAFGALALAVLIAFSAAPYALLCAPL
jgi:hypothetical protein